LVCCCLGFGIGAEYVQNRCNEEFYTGIIQNSIWKTTNKTNMLSKGYKRSLVTQVTSGKLGSDYIFHLSKFSQTTPWTYYNIINFALLIKGTKITLISNFHSNIGELVSNILHSSPVPLLKEILPNCSSIALCATCFSVFCCVNLLVQLVPRWHVLVSYRFVTEDVLLNPLSCLLTAWTWMFQRRTIVTCLLRSLCF
jgi:hypothetical protein